MKRRKGYIERLIEQGEGLHLDFKFEVSDAAKIARSLVAFANTDGGKLLIGVKDNGNIKGVRSEEEYYMIENAAGRFCRPPVEFESKEWNIRGKKILEVSIPKSNTIPHKAPDKTGRYKAFIRIADENILACGVQVKVWKKMKSNVSIRFANTLLERELLDLLQSGEPKTISHLHEHLNISKYNLENMLADFILLQLAKSIPTPEECLFTATDIPAL